MALLSASLLRKLLVVTAGLASTAVAVRGQQDEFAPPGSPAAQVAPGAEQATGPVADTGDEVTFQTFYDSLGSLGTWIQTTDYGYVWQPTVTDADWAPYTNGHWVYSDDGWAWVSDEPWAWATYHYGRWVNLDSVGWCWVPGYTWAPAWVSWRYGDGYAGWAPLPPDSFVGIDYASDDSADPNVYAGFHIGGDCDSFYSIGAGCYHFIPVICLGHPNYRHDFCPWHTNYVLINSTINVTNINVSRHAPHTSPGAPGAHVTGGHFHHVTTGGPSLAQVNSVSPTPFSPVNLVHSPHPGGGVVDNGAVHFYAPRVDPGTALSSHPSHVDRTIEHVTINRGADVTQPLAVNPQLSPRTPTAGEIQRAQMAQYNAPIHAKVVTASMVVTPVLQQPLTTMRPTTTTHQSHLIYNNTISPQPHGYGPAPGSAPAPQIYEPRPSGTPSYYGPSPAPHVIVPGYSGPAAVPHTSPQPPAAPHLYAPAPSAPVSRPAPQTAPAPSASNHSSTSSGNGSGNSSQR